MSFVQLLQQMPRALPLVSEATSAAAETAVISTTARIQSLLESHSGCSGC